MNTHHIGIDGVIGEIEHVRKFLSKLKTRQVRNNEHRDFLKATALSWFRTHRQLVSNSISPNRLQTIDIPYQIILESSERDSAKSTYVNAVKNAKEMLVLARTELLTINPINKTLDITPDFSPLASDSVMQSILARRWEECQRCLDANAPLAATVMMGGLLEALFVSRANKLSDKSKLFNSSATPIDKKTNNPLDLRQWTLAPYIDVGYDLKWISRSAKDIAAILRDYRNYIHPEKERSHGVTLSLDDAKMFWEVTKTLSRELLSMKGVA